ncbi:MAG TPA: AMMECR1 family protein, partial [Thermotogota bacterium]|nr:AMMECR1 family protein [Thermotogota bacterium]
RDPRFSPIEPEELDHLTISVDVLGAPESVENLSDLDPKEYGVIVENGFRRGLLLPDLEGVDTAAMQVAIARRKAGIGENEPVALYRFRVTRYH